MRGLMGSFSLMPLSELVEFLARRRVTGALTCERGAVKKTVHLLEGAAVESASNDPREYLGQLLINFGHLREEALARAFQRQQETNLRLGGVLVADGTVAPEVVRDTLALKLRETLLDAFRWDSGFFAVEEGPPGPRDARDALGARIELADVAREAEFRATAWEAFRAAIPSGGATLEVDAAHLPPALDPASVDGRIVALAGDGKTVDEIAVALRATDFHLYQRLYALCTRGVLRAVPPPAAPAAPAPQGAHGAAAMLRDAREHLAAGRVAEAEDAATRAADADPALDGAAELARTTRERLSRALRKALLEPPRTPAARVGRHEVAALPIAAADKWLLARCDGRRDVAALVRLAPLPELDVLKALKRLADARLVGFRAA